MKHTLLSSIRLAFMAISFFATSRAVAQCTVSVLDVSTGMYNGTPVLPGNTDPLWYCVNKTGNFTGSNPPVGSNAYVVTPNTAWAGPGAWICDTQLHATPGIVTTMTSNLTFERRFRMCAADNITFDLQFRADGIITDILVDGISTSFFQTSTNYMGSVPIWLVTFSTALSAGTHTLQVEVSDPLGTNGKDPIGFFAIGTISGASSAIVNDQDPSCAGYTCSPRCNDECYWTVDGNNIYSNRNIFGTLTNDDIRIVTNLNSVPDRGVIKGGSAATGGYLGWNTTNPTARLHINCINGNNPASMVGSPSDIRFEKLEPGNGYYLVIDDSGYVYNSGVPATSGTGARTSPDDISYLQQQVRELKMQLAELRSAIAGKPVERVAYEPINTLHQNTPNPLTNETVIRYHIESAANEAVIIIADANGRTVQKHIAHKGEGEVIMSSANLPAGTYVYSLVLDGMQIDSKKMVITK